MKVYLPSWNGDHRLESLGDLESVLKLTSPTPGELVLVGKFVRVAHKQGWLRKDSEFPAPEEGQPYAGDLRKNIILMAPLANTAKALIKIERPRKQTLTAVSYADGKLSICEGADSKALEVIEKEIAKAADEEKKEPEKKEAAAAAVKRPTPSCPNCLPGAIEPASEVLLRFLDSEQHDDWSKTRSIVVEGSYTGHRYLLAHRASRIAGRMGRMCYDLDDGFVLHFHDWSVPPEEEVLAAKLILEHRENWLRNEATCLGIGGSSRQVLKFKNPFGGGMDGTESASMADDYGMRLLKRMAPAERRATIDKMTVTGAGVTVAELGG